MKLIERDNVTELRKFGLALAAMFPVMFSLVLPWLFDHARPLWPIVVGVIFLVYSIVWPRGLYPVYRGWMRVAGVLGHVTNTLVLGLAFYVVMVPLGLILRKLGKLQYREGFDADAVSYRIDNRRHPQADELGNPF